MTLPDAGSSSIASRLEGGESVDKSRLEESTGPHKKIPWISWTAMAAPSA